MNWLDGIMDSMDMLLLLSRFSMSNSVRPHRGKPTRILCPWDSPGKNTGVGCHFLLQKHFVSILITVLQGAILYDLSKLVMSDVCFFHGSFSFLLHFPPELLLKHSHKQQKNWNNSPAISWAVKMKAVAFFILSGLVC